MLGLRLKRPPILISVNDKVMDRILRLNPPCNALFLDVRCGISDHSLRIADRGYQCVDLSLSTALNTARKNAALRGRASRRPLVRQGSEDLAFEDAFDAVHCRVLMHVLQWEEVLASNASPAS
jgi:SAM-dependent methyltransferase